MKNDKEEGQKSENLEKLRMLMEVAGIDVSQYSISIKKENGREPLPPTIMLFQAFSALAASNLSPSACKVLFFFFSQSHYQNIISMDQFTIAENIGMTERSVRSAVKELKDQGIISAVSYINDKRRNEYFLNPYSSWKGSAKQRQEAINAIDPDQLSLFGRDAKQLKEAEREGMKNNN